MKQKKSVNSKAKYYIDKLELLPHPEGGYYKEVYRADENINSASLPQRYEGKRTFSTSIYFLLDGEEFSSFHRLKSDELWHFYDGSSIKIYIINSDGVLITRTLGRDLENDQELQVTIPRLSWFAAEVIDKNSYTLIGCTVAPGFDFNDFEIGERAALSKSFPEHIDLINKFSR